MSLSTETLSSAPLPAASLVSTLRSVYLAPVYVLVSGLQGLGAEIAKNLVLAGVESLTLHDDGVVDVCDLSSNFCLSEKDVGHNRAQASFQKIKELDNVVITSVLTGDLTKEQLADFQVVVFTGISLEKAIEFDDYCHSHQPPIAFIKSEVCGLFGSVFCDFGPEFTVLDVDGEEPHTGIIASISNDVNSEVFCVDENCLKFKDGDLVVFSEVHGMTELNDGKPRKIKNSRPYSFAIEEDTSSFGKYIGGGIVTQVKPAKVIKFKPLKDAMIEPGVAVSSDISKFESASLLHLAFHALDKFRNEFKRLPSAGCTDDVQRMIDFAISINETLGDRKLEEIDRKCLHHFASGSKAVLNPMSAIYGGIVGQEVMKACSRKFHPIYQFFYFDSVESLFDEPLEIGDLKPENTRYDGQISVFGSKFQNELEQANIFMVGLGQYGCEFLKNVALMGMSCSQNGKLTVIDDDVIEESNLSRQFLLRKGNVGQSKSTAAATAALAINPKLHVKVVQKRGNLETKTVFDDSIWESLDAVVSAGLDNVTERMYIDSKCLYFQKPHLEFGILGAKCSTQMVMPCIAENQAATRDPPEKPAAKFTVHPFPHNIGQCLIWARSEFEGLLEKTPIEVNSFLSNPSAYLAAARTAADAQAKDQLERVMEWLDRDKCVTFQDCIICEKKQRIDKPASTHKLQKPASFSSFKELLRSIALDASSSKAATSSSSPHTAPIHDTAVVVSPPSRSCLSLSPGSASLLVLIPDWGLTFYVRVDLGGSFHTYPHLGGPFQSLQDVNSAIDRHLQDRWDPKMAAIDRYLQDRHDPKKCKEHNEDFLREMPVLLTLYRPDGTRKKCSKSEATERYRNKMLLLVQALVDKYNDDYNLLEDLAYELKDLLHYQFICEARGTSSKKNRYYHLNFTTKPKRADDFDCGMDNLFFVELMDGEHEEMLVNCFCMVKSNDNGHCYGCTNNGSVDMKHPNNADAYTGGHLNVRLPSGDVTEWPSYFDEDLDAEEARVRRIYRPLVIIRWNSLHATPLLEI